MNNDLISRQAIIKDIQDLLKSPYGKDDNIGRVFKRDIAETIIDLCVKNQPTVNQWIDVKDRMPEEDKEVLICSQWGTIDVGWHYDTYWATEHNTYEEDGDIVAWMPLPEPYKKEVE